MTLPLLVVIKNEKMFRELKTALGHIKSSNAKKTKKAQNGSKPCKIFKWLLLRIFPVLLWMNHVYYILLSLFSQEVWNLGLTGPQIVENLNNENIKLATFYVLLAIFYWLFVSCSLLTRCLLHYYFLLAIYYLLFATCYLLFAICYLLLASCYFILTV